MTDEHTEPAGTVEPDWDVTFNAEELESLYPNQQSATEWDGDLTVVIGGPGAGKTTTINLCADRLTGTSNVAPDECTILSFNRSVAHELEQSLRAELGARGHEVDVRTAHAKAREVLAAAPVTARTTPSEFEIADEYDSLLALQRVLQQLDPGDEGPSKQRINAIAGQITTLQQAGLTPDTLDAALGDMRVYHEVEHLLDELSTVAASLLRPTEVTSTTLARIRARLVTVADVLETQIPEDWAELDATLARTAWQYVDLLRKTAARAATWFDEQAEAICSQAPTLAALPAHLLGDEHASTHLDGEVGACSVSHWPHREATLFIQEVLNAAEVAPIWRSYVQELERREGVDFETVLADAVQVLETHPEIRDELTVSRVIVDEGQDLSPPMLRFAQLLTDEEILLLGDTAQTINEWAGANRRSIDSLVDAGATEIQLETDFRKAPGIEAFCDRFRASIADEEALNMRSHRDRAAGTKEAAPWPADPVRWVTDGGDLESAYQAVIDMLQQDNVPGWAVPDEASLASLARGTSTVEALQTRLAASGGTDDEPADSTEAVRDLLWLLRVLSVRTGAHDRTEYVGQFDTEDEAPASVERLPSVLARFYDIPVAVSEAAFDTEAEDAWVALVRLVEYDAPADLPVPAYRDAYERVYRELVTLARRIQREPLARLVPSLIEQYGLERDVTGTDEAIEALREAAESLTAPDETVPPAADLGAIQQLQDRWEAKLGSASVDRHDVSTVHRYKGGEADIVVVAVSPGDWQVFDTSPKAALQERAANGLTRVRHQLAFDESVVTQSFIERQRHNERRVAYTAISRPRDLLVLVGHGRPTPRPATGDVDPDECLPAAVDRVENAGPLDIWTELRAAMPRDAAREWSRDALGLTDDGGDA